MRPLLALKYLSEKCILGFVSILCFLCFLRGLPGENRMLQRVLQSEPKRGLECYRNLYGIN